MEDSTWDGDVPPVTDEEIANTLAELGGVDVLDKACLNGEVYGGACALHRQPAPENCNSAATDRAAALGISENEAWGIMAGWDYGGECDQYRAMGGEYSRSSEHDAMFNRGVRRGRRLAELVRRGTVA